MILDYFNDCTQHSIVFLLQRGAGKAESHHGGVVGVGDHQGMPKLAEGTSAEWVESERPG